MSSLHFYYPDGKSDMVFSYEEALRVVEERCGVVIDCRKFTQNCIICVNYWKNLLRKEESSVTLWENCTISYTTLFRTVTANLAKSHTN